MVKCPDRTCGSENCILINPTGKIPKYKCMTCNGLPFMEEKVRIAVCIKISKDDLTLRKVDKGIVNKKLFAFWAETDSFGAHLKAFIDENDPEFYRRATKATTIERDFRRKIDGNEDGLNATYRKEDSKIAA